MIYWIPCLTMDMTTKHTGKTLHVNGFVTLDITPISFVFPGLLLIKEACKTYAGLQPVILALP
eukprot:m.100985 g.100985  ORF g.100985 m.100985 type:complete len:63 (+) comp37104_c0_seq1:775-963(+)